MSTTPIDLYSIPMDELRRLAEMSAVSDNVQRTVTEPVSPNGESEPEVETQLPPRDELGRFTKAEGSEPPVNETEEVQTEDPAAPVEEYTATIDIGDGAGVQVFSAPTKDELLTKLIEAQENATRKIRELSTKKTEAPKVEPAAPTPDEELALAQEFLANPHAAFDRLYEKRRQEERQREAEAARQAEESAKAVDAAAKQFIQATPDYYEHPKNAARIEGWLKLNGNLDPTFENIQAAYNDLNGDGLLLPKPAAAPARTARSSGISVRRSVAPPVQTKSEVELRDELYAMPLDKLRESLMARR